MGLTIYAYASKDAPTAETNGRDPWQCTEPGLMEDAGKDTQIFEWDRYWDLHCWFHNLFVEKCGVYNDGSVPFSYPDCVALDGRDLDRLKHVILNLKLPSCDSYLDVKSEGPSLCDVWKHNVNEAAKLALADSFSKHLRWFKETLIFIKRADCLIENGNHIYVFSSW